MSEAPQDGTTIIASVMNHSGVPETGHGCFERIQWRVRDCHGSWYAIESTETFSVIYGESSILAWWPDGTPEDQMEKRERTNWKFIPSNGSHGDGIYESWCSTCIRERAVRENHEYAFANGLGCDILVRTMAFRISDPEYPEEWTYKDGGPKCTAREIDNGQKLQEPRCTETPDMFQEPK